MKTPPKKLRFALLPRFTLVEVVVALAILGMSLSAFFAISQNAMLRADKAYDHWRRSHLLSLAAEYYLLFPSEDPPEPPEGLLDDPDYHVEIRYDDAEGLPDDLAGLENLAPLRTLVIELVRNGDNQVVDTLKIDRIDLNPDLES